MYVHTFNIKYCSTQRNIQLQTNIALKFNVESRIQKTKNSKDHLDSNLITVLTVNYNHLCL